MHAAFPIKGKGHPSVDKCERGMPEIAVSTQQVPGAVFVLQPFFHATSPPTATHPFTRINDKRHSYNSEKTTEVQGASAGC